MSSSDVLLTIEAGDWDRLCAPNLEFLREFYWLSTLGGSREVQLTRLEALLILHGVPYRLGADDE